MKTSPDLPLRLAAHQPEGVAELADLLFSGLVERPMWESFLVRLAQRLGGGQAAFLISPHRQTLGECAVLVPQGCSADPFSSLLGFEGFVALAFAQPQSLSHQARDYAVLRMELDNDRSAWLVCVGAEGCSARFAAAAAKSFSSQAYCSDPTFKKYITIKKE